MNESMINIDCFIQHPYINVLVLQNRMNTKIEQQSLLPPTHDDFIGFNNARQEINL